MLVMVEHLQKDKHSGIFKYRRRVPQELQGALGKREIVVSLKTRDRETALRKRDAIHREVEQHLSQLSSSAPEQLDYKHTMRLLYEAGIARRSEEAVPASDPADHETAMRYRDKLLAEAAKLSPEELKKPLNEGSDGVRLLARTIVKGVEKPDTRLRDAVNAYLDEQATKDNFEDLRKQTRLVAEALEQIVGESNPALIDVTHDDAYEFRDHWIKKKVCSPATAQRRLNTIKAIFNFAIRRFRLTNYQNPFADVGVKGVNKGAKERRDALTLEEIRRCEPHIARLNQDAQDLWTLMMFTGARPKELTTLEKCDVVLDHPVPHIIIRDNELGRVKANNSTRKVPLVGKALDTAHRRLRDLEGEPDAAPLIARYSDPRGSDSATQLLSKAMKAAGVWKHQQKVPYSLRHSVKDWLRRVGSEFHADLIQGHGAGTISRTYGSDDMLDDLRETLRKALVRAKVLDPEGD